jgi:hypothetical protein
VKKAPKPAIGPRLAQSRHVALALALLQGIFCGGLEGQTSSQMGHAEAVYFRKILVFVQWPPRQGTPEEVFRVCVAGRSAIGFTLAEELRATTVEGQRVDVRMVQKEESLMNCQVLFVNTSDARQRAKLLESVKGTHVLTVGEDRGFLDAGGVLEFSAAGSTMQFAINLAAAKNAGLRFDARLLSLAQRVLKEKGAAGT